MNKCKDCNFYEKMKWHKSIDKDESYQLHGKCKLLKRVLEINNSNLFFIDHLIVSEEFGCNLWREKEE